MFPYVWSLSSDQFVESDNYRVNTSYEHGTLLGLRFTAVRKVHICSHGSYIDLQGKKILILIFEMQKVELSQCSCPLKSIMSIYLDYHFISPTIF